MILSSQSFKNKKSHSQEYCEKEQINENIYTKFSIPNSKNEWKGIINKLKSMIYMNIEVEDKYRPCTSPSRIYKKVLPNDRPTSSPNNTNRKRYQELPRFSKKMHEIYRYKIDNKPTILQNEKYDYEKYNYERFNYNQYKLPSLQKYKVTFLS